MNSDINQRGLPFDGRAPTSFTINASILCLKITSQDLKVVLSGFKIFEQLVTLQGGELWNISNNEIYGIWPDDVSNEPTQYLIYRASRSFLENGFWKLRLELFFFSSSMWN